MFRKSGLSGLKHTYSSSSWKMICVWWPITFPRIEITMVERMAFYHKNTLCSVFNWSTLVLKYSATKSIFSDMVNSLIPSYFESCRGFQFFWDVAEYCYYLKLLHIFKMLSPHFHLGLCSHINSHLFSNEMIKFISLVKPIM